MSNRQISESSLQRFDGLGAFVVLMTNDSEIVPAKLIDGKYGLCWLITDESWEEELGRKFIPADSSHSNSGHENRSRIQLEKGLFQIYELAEARVSRKGGDICRIDWVEYGSWKGNPYWDFEDEVLNPELFEEKEGK
jgi:hypothetical protein